MGKTSDSSRKISLSKPSNIITGFCNHQIAEPHKASMVKIRGTLIGRENDIYKTDRITWDHITS